jgi:uncharacterized membrane protein
MGGREVRGGTREGERQRVRVLGVEVDCACVSEIVKCYYIVSHIYMGMFLYMPLEVEGCACVLYSSIPVPYRCCACILFHAVSGIK